MKRFIKSTLLSLLLIFSMMLPLIAGAQSEPANTETIPHISITDAIDKAKQSASESNNAKQNNLPVIIDDPFDVESTHAILVETTTDNILIQKNIHEKIAPGELAKLMTAIIASEYAMFDDVVTVSETAVKNSQSYNAVSRLKVGEQLTVRQLLYCLILDNSDVAAYALAEHITGSYADFAVLMNEKAKFIGAQNTNFTNPTGRYDKEQYSTVWDLYVISEYFMQNKDLLEISSTVRYTLPVSGRRTSRTRFYTNNHLLSL